MALYAEKPTDALLSILNRSVLCRGLATSEINDIARALRPVSFDSGNVIYGQDEPADKMYIIAAGRVRLAMERAGAPIQLLEYLSKGDHFGEMALLTETSRATAAIAMMDCRLLELDQDNFQRLLVTTPGFAANLSRSLGYRLRWQSSGKQRRQGPNVVALVCAGQRARRVAPLLAETIIARGKNVTVATDRIAGWPTPGMCDAREIILGQRGELVHQRLSQALESHERVLLDLSQLSPHNQLAGVLAHCEEIWWLAEPKTGDDARRHLRSLLNYEPKIGCRVHFVWVLPDSEQPAPRTPRELGIAKEDFKIVVADERQPALREQRQGFSRLWRRMQGVKVGIALGGGGARGLAHPGVLHSLEQAGVFFDHIAGTSSGALMGLPYASGLDPVLFPERFKAALTPHRIFRLLPGGNRWYLWAMFRTGAWDRMLRPYFGAARLEQLQIPLSTVAVDLISGQQVVRDEGDAIHAVLESINFPPVARPILRDGMALVDGGLLNNLPADVLPPRGADVVVGVNVVSKLNPTFAGATSQTPANQMKRPGMIQTLFRANEVQDYGLHALRSRALDVLISPDTSAFEFADFTQAPRLFEAGQAAGEEAAAQVKQTLSDMDIS